MEPDYGALGEHLKKNGGDGSNIDLVKNAYLFGLNSAEARFNKRHMELWGHIFKADGELKKLMKKWNKSRREFKQLTGE